MYCGEWAPCLIISILSTGKFHSFLFCHSITKTILCWDIIAIVMLQHNKNTDLLLLTVLFAPIQALTLQEKNKCPLPYEPFKSDI